MADPSEVARLAAQEKHEARVLVLAQGLRDAAQRQYDEVVAAHAAEMADHQTGLAGLEAECRAAEAAYETARAALEQQYRNLEQIRDTTNRAVSSHLERVRTSTARLAELRPRLTVESWMTQAADDASAGTASA